MKDFYFVLEDFLKIIFLHGRIFEFSSFFFCLYILSIVNGKAVQCDTPLVSNESQLVPTNLDLGPPPKMVLKHKICKISYLWWRLWAIESECFLFSIW